jgi:hemolysin D
VRLLTGECGDLGAVLVVVQQLAIHTVGGVVTPAQSLLVVVPINSRLEIEAMVSNRDIGFVHPGKKPRSMANAPAWERTPTIRSKRLAITSANRKQDGLKSNSCQSTALR